MSFSPIAIIGRSCVLPGALSPAALWDAVVAGHNLLSTAPAGRWGMAARDVVRDAKTAAGDSAWTDRGGYVDGFDDIFDPTGFAIRPEELDGLDPLFSWVLHTAREALRDGGRLDRGDRIGAVFGNLSFPSSSMSTFAASVWLDAQAGYDVEVQRRAGLTHPDPRNRFMSGLPALLLARALHLEAGAHALDAACASSLYAISLACDRLHDGTADTMLAGAVNRADDLFIHVGFSALSALSPSGRSRPFHRGADGLVPAEGAGFVALRRLEDAVRDGDPIHGVIRGVGLSNDGRGRGLLAPAEEGQTRALRTAYERSGVDPASISLVECHATGTQVGDATELRSMAAVFGGASSLPIGSLKSNLGHLITAAGVAGLIKVVEAMRAGVRPPTLHVDEPSPELAGTPLRVLGTAEPWHVDGPRRAGVSAFGFGGNNAHLIVEQYRADDMPLTVAVAQRADEPEVAIVGIGAVVAAHASRAAFSDALFCHKASDSGARSSLAAAHQGRALDSVELPLAGLRFPPRDLQQSLAQQLLTLHAANEAVAEVDDLPSERTGVVIGMGADPEVCRYGVRWRLLDWARSWQVEASDWLPTARDAVIPTLESAGVIGTMPNMPANRLNSQFDLRGPSMTVSSEESSGLHALEIGRRALAHGELDVALVGAVDVAREPVQRAAAMAVLPADRHEPGDAAVVMVLKRLVDAERDGDRIYAVVGATRDETCSEEADLPRIGLAPGATALTSRFGHAHAASGMVHVAAAALSLHTRTSVDGRPWVTRSENNQGRQVEVTVDASEGQRSRVALREYPASPSRRERPTPRLYVYSGADAAEVAAALDADRPSDDGPARLVIVAADHQELGQRRAAARAHLLEGAPTFEGIHFRVRPVGGEVAFVFPGAGAAYHGMGRELLYALPELGDQLRERFRGLADVLEWVHGDPGVAPHATDQLWGASVLCQLHMQLTRYVGLTPHAAIGYSSGESNSLFATGAWTDMDAMRDEIRESGMFSRELGGDFEAVARAWGRPVEWAMWAVRRPFSVVEPQLADEEHVHLAIVSSPEECVIAGDAHGCERVVAQLGRDRCHRLGYEVAAHVPEVAEFRQPWLDIHRRRVSPPTDVRIYSNASNQAYTPDSDSCSQAIYDQAVRTMVFPTTIERAWADGVRTFVELGPRDTCSRWIRQTLGDRDAVVCAFDAPGRGVRPLFEALAALVAGGVEVDHTRLSDRLEPHRPVASVDGPKLTLLTHLPPILLPALPNVIEDQSMDLFEVELVANPPPDPSRMYAMPPAPLLPSSTDVFADPRPRATAARASAAILSDTPRAAAAAPSPAISIAASHDVRVATPTLSTNPTGAVSQGSASGLNEVFARLGAHMAHVGALHRDFINQQQALHEQFLSARETSIRSLPVASRGDSPATLASPALPIAIARTETPVPTAQAPRVAGVQPATSSRSPSAAPPAPPVAPAFTTPTIRFDRRQLKTHASGKISSIFGPMFERQDGYHRQVRMPEPPLLLADRVSSLTAEPGSMGVGTIVTETDVHTDSWYLNRGYMPAGIMIESGQADLMLISYLGIDFHNKSERVYRLLGCQLTYHGSLPKPGETLSYEITVDGHANQGPVRLFFFHYDCHVAGELRLAVRGGQAGFFTDQELDESAGVLWSPEEQEIVATPRLDSPDVVCTRRSFSNEQVRAFSDGDTFACFGPGFEHAQTHVRSPSIQSGRLTFLDHIVDLDTSGGPWGRGYLRAETPVKPDDHYFEGHFYNDPCMPGNFMFEGCLQAMSFYLTALGFTLKRDGWRFQPVSGEPFDLRCRGQVTPSSKHLTYELFVEEVISGPTPTVFGDLLVTCDGVKAFHARRVGIELCPDWPITSRPELLAEYIEPKPVASREGFAFDYASLLACAWGKPSDAFGPMYAPFDGHRKVARLPGPPYHFMSRVSRIEGDLGALVTGGGVEIEYDVPPSEWYFTENGAATMPFAVLLEAALQPCGWLASFVGSALVGDEDLKFRNLDGTGTLLTEVLPNSGTLRTVVKIKSISRSAGMILETFDVECFLGDEKVYTLDTGFGFFPTIALENQVGLPTDDARRAVLTDASDYLVDLTTHPERYCGGSVRLARPMLLMIDRVTGYWPEGGEKGLGRLRAEKDVDPAEWFFKAHFFQDPVQPGSLGIEAMVQLLQFFMLETGMHEGIDHPRFECLGTDIPMTWKYRGQVIPSNRVISTTIEITQVGRDDRGPFAIATSSLWVDGKRIYEASNLGMRIVSDPNPVPVPAPERAPAGTRALDPSVDTWLNDHRPTWNRPALPMMSIVDELATAVPGQVIALERVKVERWCDFEGPRRLRTEVDGDRVTLLASTDGGEQRIASGRVHTGNFATPPQPLSALDGEIVTDVYASGALFHGPAFQLMTSLVMGRDGASSVLDAGAGKVPRGRLHPALLDAATHGIPHDRLDRWSDRIGADKVAYPALLERLDIYGPTPSEGPVRVEARLDGFLTAPDFPRLRIQLIVDNRVWAELRLVEACFPKGPLGSAAPADRVAFLRDGRYVAGLRLSRVVDGVTRLTAAEVAATDWLPGTVDGIYGTRDVEAIAVKEHRAAIEELHPRVLPEALPLSRFSDDVTRDGDDVCVATSAPTVLDLAPVRDWWNRYLGTPPGWLGDDLWTGVIERYVRRVVITDPVAWATLEGRPAIFVGNHQIQIESLLITNLLAVLSDRPVRTMANEKHARGWIGWLLRQLWSYPGCRNPDTIVYFDQSQPQTMLDIVAELRNDLRERGMSFFVHPQGTRGRSCRERVTKISSLFIDLALELDAPIVPVRFTGGLPFDPIEGKLELPVGHGKQDYWLGDPIEATELRSLPHAERASRIIDAMNTLGPSPDDEQPHEGDPIFAAAVGERQKRTGVGEVEATLLEVLMSIEAPGAETLQLLDQTFDDDEHGRWLKAMNERLRRANTSSD